MVDSQGTTDMEGKYVKKALTIQAAVSYRVGDCTVSGPQKFAFCESVLKGPALKRVVYGQCHRKLKT